MFPGVFGVPELRFPLQWKYSNENKTLMIFSNKTPCPPFSLLSLQSCEVVVVVVVMLSISRKLSSRNNNINGVNKWSVIIKRAGGGSAS